MEQEMRWIRRQPVLRRTLLGSALALACCLPFCLRAEAAPAPPIYVNGSQTSVRAVERNKRVFVPMRGVFEKLGATVDYSPPGTVAAKKNGTNLARLTLGSRAAMVQGSARQLEAAPFKSGSRIFVPLRFISEAAGAKVAYTSAPRSIHITSGPTPVAATHPAAQRHGIPWWVWLLLALLVLLLLLRFLRRPSRDAVISTRSSSGPTISTTGRN